MLSGAKHILHDRLVLFSFSFFFFLFFFCVQAEFCWVQQYICQRTRKDSLHFTANKRRSKAALLDHNNRIEILEIGAVFLSQKKCYFFKLYISYKQNKISPTVMFIRTVDV